MTGILGAFLFSVMVSLSERAATWADTSPAPGRATSEHAEYLHELAGNSGYASLVSVATSTVFVIAAATCGTALRVSSVVGLVLATHLLLILLMVMKRVFVLTQRRLVKARTGAGE